MIPSKLFSSPRSAMYIGNSFLLLALLSRWILRPSARLSPDLVDGGIGFLFGIAIASLMVGVVLRSRARNSRNSGPTA